MGFVSIHINNFIFAHKCKTALDSVLGQMEMQSKQKKTWKKQVEQTLLFDFAWNIKLARLFIIRRYIKETIYEIFWLDSISWYRENSFKCCFYYERRIKENMKCGNIFFVSEMESLNIRIRIKCRNIWITSLEIVTEKNLHFYLSSFWKNFYVI